jgi:hypothetical protein
VPDFFRELVICGASLKQHAKTASDLLEAHASGLRAQKSGDRS